MTPTNTPAPASEAADVERVAANLVKIADASVRSDGTDIPLGEQCRLGAATIRSLKERLAEAERQRDEAVSLLEPFAKHIDEMRFDIDNKGNPLPDDQAVGWVYVTNGDFRRARAALQRESSTALESGKTEGGGE